MTRMPILVASCVLYIQYILHGFGSFLLSGDSDMGVSVQGEPGGEVAEDGGDSFNVYAVLQGYCCEGVAEVMEANFWDTRPAMWITIEE